MILNLSRALPRSEPSSFSVVASLCHGFLRSNEDNLSVEKKYDAVVDDATVKDGHGSSDEHAGPGGMREFEKFEQNLPAVIECVWLHEMILTAVAGYLKL